MSVRINRSEIVQEDHGHSTVWRHFRRDGPYGVGVGIAAFHPRPDDLDVESAAEAHDVPEVHYVLSGTGILFEEGESIELRSGDAVITPAGRRHVFWSTSAEPLVTVYVAVGRDALLGERR